MTAPVRTRFAPSPTGRLHIGNARTALFNYLFARRYGGEMWLRIEDTDAGRSGEEHVPAIEADLRWLGLDWPGGGKLWRQSQRTEVYARYFEHLESTSRAYPCFCTAEELERSRREQRAAGRAPRYSGRCARLSPSEAQALRTEGRRPTLRFRVEPERRWVFNDLVRGEQVFPGGDIGDFVIRRADGSPAFFFSNAVDDALSGISHVLRAEDHLANTPRQLMLLEALELEAPRYGHVALVVDEQGAPLSKRAGAPALAELRELGYLPGAVVNHLARLGHHYAEDVCLDLAGLAEGFAPEHLGRAPARFDVQQLRHWQQEALAGLDPAALAAWAENALAEVPAPARERFLNAVRPNVLFPEEVAAWARVVFGEPGEPPASLRQDLCAAGPELFRAALEVWDETGDDFRAFAQQLRTRTGLKGRALYHPLRLCLTGREAGPELAELMALMPRPILRERLAGCARLCGGEKP